MTEHGDRPVIRELKDYVQHLAHCPKAPRWTPAVAPEQFTCACGLSDLPAAVSTGAQEPPTPDWITDRSLGIGLEIPPDGEYFLASHAPGPAPLAEICQRLVDALRGDECGHVLGSPHAAHCPVCRAVAELLVAISAGASAPGPARAETEQVRADAELVVYQRTLVDGLPRFQHPEGGECVNLTAVLLALIGDPPRSEPPQGDPR
jgi:hypothetical protein